jgi:tetratricopeptide (TPR) repeat protein
MQPLRRQPDAEPSLRQLFEELVDLDEPRRVQRMDELRHELAPPRLGALAALLEGDANQLPVLATSLADAADRWRDSDRVGEQFIGRAIGPFRLTGVLGRGGSSLVFRAERAAGDAVQTVALKLLRNGLFNAESQRRFAREQAILAQLTHPNIARLIEGGVSDGGLPYIAMEMVEGEPITLHADASSLSVRQRLMLVATLCRAIEAAHAALVVHRDLKPSNVYVDHDGSIKVLDFGIAKLLDDDAQQTQTVMLTPEYAAPEQYRAGSTTTAVDVYALGVLLGELLTGRRLGGAATTRASLVAQSLDVQPPRGLPSCDRLARQLRGDLDAIIATALAEEPGLRYRSAGAMADDIDRYLDGRPVNAHRPSRWYRARKFMRRHRGGVLIVTLFSLAVLASLALAVWQAHVARRAVLAEKAELSRANSLRNFMFDAFAQAEPGNADAGDATVVDVVERAIATANADRSADPRARVDLLIRLAQVLNARGKLDRAAELLEAMQRGASAGLKPGDPLLQEIEHAVIFNLVERGDLDEARRRTDQLLDSLPEDAHAALVSAWGESAVIAGRQRDLERAVRDGTEALRRARALDDADLLSRALTGLGSALRDAGRADESIGLLEENLARMRARFGDAHVAVSGAEDALARAYRRAGNLVSAERHARAALAIDDRALPRDHPRRATHLNALTMVLVERRDFEQALVTVQESIRMQADAGGDPDHLAANYGMLSRVQAALGSIPAALDASRRAMDIHRSSGRERSWLGIRERSNLGWVLALNRQRAAGEAELDRALSDARASEHPDAEVIAAILERRTRIALDADDRAVAHALMQRYAASAAPLVARPSWPGRVAILRAELLLADGKASEARDALASAAPEFASGVRIDPVVATTRALLVAILAARRDDPAQSTLAARAKALVGSLPYPPIHVQRLAQRL